jgi:uridine phosphorylase
MKQIAESELILNNDGSIYHLNLLPEDISDTIITVGDPDRVEMVSSFFEKIEIKKRKREFVTHTGFYRGKRITVLSTGIGTDNIDIVFNELDALVNVDLKKRVIKEDRISLKIIRIGTSGSLHKDIPVDSFICSSYGLGLDGLLNHYSFTNTDSEQNIITAFNKNYPVNIGLPKPYLFKSSDNLYKLLGSDTPSGITASCQGFYGPQGRSIRLQPAFKEIIPFLMEFDHSGHRITNFEMETGAMYGLASLLGHACCSVNLIIANRITGRFSADPYKAMQSLIENILIKLSA